MSDLFDFVQSYWFELGSLTAQFAILAVVVWYARKSLSIQAASQRQAEPAARPVEAPAAFRAIEAPRPSPAPAYGGVGNVLSVAPVARALEAEPVAALRVRRVNPARAMVRWLREPWNTEANRRILAAAQRQREAAARSMETADSIEPEEAPASTYRGVGQMFSPMAESAALESEAAAVHRVRRTSPWRATINWLRAPIGSGSRSAA